MKDVSTSFNHSNLNLSMFNPTLTIDICVFQ